MFNVNSLKGAVAPFAVVGAVVGTLAAAIAIDLWFKEGAENASGLTPEFLATQLIGKYDRVEPSGAKDGVIALANPSGLDEFAETRRTQVVAGLVARGGEYTAWPIASRADALGNKDGFADHAELVAVIRTYDTRGEKGVLTATEQHDLNVAFDEVGWPTAPGSVPGETYLRNHHVDE